MDIHFNEKVKCGADYVALRVIENGSKIESDGILISESGFSNSKLGFYQIEDIGETGKKEYGLKVGDYVLADRLSIFYKSEPIGIIKYNNIIVKTNESKTEFFPLKNMCFIKKSIKKTSEKDGILVVNNNTELQIGEITAKNMVDVEFPFDVGDKVLLTKGADVIQLGSSEVFIYKHDMILCQILD